MNKKCLIEIIRVDESIEHHTLSNHGLIIAVTAMIGAEVCDSVNLMNGKVMIVDDTGKLEGKPINPIATDLYHIKCGWVTANSIHGDVAICTDNDFA